MRRPRRLRHPPAAAGDSAGVAEVAVAVGGEHEVAVAVGGEHAMVASRGGCLVPTCSAPSRLTSGVRQAMESAEQQRSANRSKAMPR